MPQLCFIITCVGLLKSPVVAVLKSFPRTVVFLLLCVFLVLAADIDQFLWFIVERFELKTSVELPSRETAYCSKLNIRAGHLYVFENQKGEIPPFCHHVVRYFYTYGYVCQEALIAGKKSSHYKAVDRYLCCYQHFSLEFSNKMCNRGRAPFHAVKAWGCRGVAPLSLNLRVDGSVWLPRSAALSQRKKNFSGAGFVFSKPVWMFWRRGISVIFENRAPDHLARNLSVYLLKCLLIADCFIPWSCLVKNFVYIFRESLVIYHYRAYIYM